MSTIWQWNRAAHNVFECTVVLDHFFCFCISRINQGVLQVVDDLIQRIPKGVFVF